MTSIENYENYIIFENGDLLNILKGRMNKFSINKEGYKDIRLCKNGKQKHFRLHRLLALAYIPNPENKEYIDHINRDKLDNRLENLRWVSPLENSQNQNIRIDNTSGEKNIRFRKARDTWEFSKTINKIRFRKSFKTKEEAIECKKEFYKDNNLEYI